MRTLTKRTLQYCGLQIHIDTTVKSVTTTVQGNNLTTHNLDMLLDTLTIWSKLGYITLTGDTTKLLDVQTGVELDIVNNN